MPFNELNTEETLDPQDWSKAAALAHKMIDDAIAHIANVRDRPVWQPMPDNVRNYFSSPLPEKPGDLAEAYKALGENLMPYSMGNIHPRFWGWYMGSGNFTGALADFLAAIEGSNLGGGNTAACELDRQVVSWLKSMTGFPASASGTLTSGGSMANLVCLTVARNVTAGIDVRAEGITALPQSLRFYASDQAHSCIQKGLEILGLGARSLHLIPSKPDFTMDIAALELAIAADKGNGHKPVCVVATAGTTNTGAIDDMRAIDDICRKYDLWFHVDGCIGALLKIAPINKTKVEGIELADSLSLDPHKWLHAPFEVGCALVKDAKQHRDSFAVHHAYLEEKPRGIGSGEFLADYSLELSRNLKALKVWFSLKENGAEKFGRLIDQNIAQAKYLTGLVQAEPRLELMAPTSINIVCFRYVFLGADEPSLKSINTEIMLRLQEQGIAAPSDTTINSRHCIRAAITNHRTRREDLDLLVREVLRIGTELGS
jgi:aromatic-L-amino-acid decarboxylase